ncbi:MAG TPA: hypothetical protein VGC38_00665 [Pseudolabrys sp.]
MRKIVILAGLLTSAALFTGSAAKAEVGCQCVKLGAPSICVSGVGACNKYGGLCLAPCDYKPKMMRHHKKKA